MMITSGDVTMNKFNETEHSLVSQNLISLPWGEVHIYVNETITREIVRNKHI